MPEDSQNESESKKASKLNRRDLLLILLGVAVGIIVVIAAFAFLQKPKAV